MSGQSYGSPIVDQDPSTDDYSGVDALSYGLSTLVMGEDVFNRLPLSQSVRNS
jgi:hypothetical protein